MSPEIICVTGTSAAGKTTIVNALLERGAGKLKFQRVVTATDRAPREGEVDGVDYHFMSTEEFTRVANPGLSVEQFKHLLNASLPKVDIMRIIGTEGFLECALVYDQLKGIPRRAIRAIRRKGRIPVLVIDIQGVQLLRELEGAEKVLTIAVVPPSIEVARARILSRNPEIGVEELDRRMKVAELEIEDVMNSDNYDHVVMSYDGKQDESVLDVQEFIKSAFENRPRLRAS